MLRRWRRPFDRDRAERARNKFIEIQILIDALDRAIGGERITAATAESVAYAANPPRAPLLQAAPAKA